MQAVRAGIVAVTSRSSIQRERRPSARRCSPMVMGVGGATRSSVSSPSGALRAPLPSSSQAPTSARPTRTSLTTMVAGAILRDNTLIWRLHPSKHLLTRLLASSLSNSAASHARGLAESGSASRETTTGSYSTS
jgi:hypothetical protein